MSSAFVPDTGGPEDIDDDAQRRIDQQHGLFSPTSGFPQILDDLYIQMGSYEEVDPRFHELTGPEGDLRGGTHQIARDYARRELPFSLVKERFWEFDGADLEKAQRALWEAGYLAKEPVLWGVREADNDDFQAWGYAAKDAVRLGLPLDQLLSKRAEQRKAAGVGGAGSEGSRNRDIALTSVDDARAMADEIGKSVVGRKLSPEETAKVVDILHSRQRSEQAAANSVANSDTGGGTLTNPTSAQTVVEGAIESQLPTESKAKSTADQFASLLGMMGGQ